MAPAVAAGRGARAHRRRWHARDVTLAAVAAQLSRLHGELAHHDAAEGGHPHPRNCVMNLVVCVEGRRRAAAAGRAVEALAAGHPLRALVLDRRPGGRGHAKGFEAAIVSESRRLLHGAPVEREQVTLTLPAGSAGRLAGIVDPLLMSDVPTFLWWVGPPGPDHPAVGDLLAVSDALIVDSAHFERPLDDLLELAALADRPGGRVSFADLRWARQRPWRESLARAFTPAARRPLLTGLRTVELRCAGEGQVARAGGALLVGWLASSLGWRLTRSAGVSEQAADAQMETSRGRVLQVRLRPYPEAAAPVAGELCAVRLEGEAGDAPFALTMELDVGRGDHAHLRLELSEREAVDQRLAIPRAGEAELLVQLLVSGRRDRVFLRSLAAAAALVDGLR